MVVVTQSGSPFVALMVNDHQQTLHSSNDGQGAGFQWHGSSRALLRWDTTMKVNPRSFTDPTADLAIARILREEQPPKRGRRRTLPAWVEKVAQGGDAVKA